MQSPVGAAQSEARPVPAPAPSLFRRGVRAGRRSARRWRVELSNLALSLQAPELGPPVAILGNGRSGTSWIGKTVGRAEGALYYREPCHPRTTGIDDDTVWSRYVPPDGDDPHFRRCLETAFRGRLLDVNEWSLDEVSARFGGTRRVVVKEVACFLSAEWVYRRWRPRTVIVVRHPCPSVRSVQRLGLAAPERRRFRELIENPRLVDEYLAPFLPHLQRLESPLELSAAIWAIKNHVAVQALARHPEWILMRYEDVCAQPLDRFRWLFEQLALPWSLELEQWLNESTTQWEAGPHATSKISSQQIDGWRQQMTPEERDTVRRVVAPFCLPFYQRDDEW